MATSTIPEATKAARAAWCQLLEATQLSGLPAASLRRQVALGAVRIKPAAGGRYLYNRGDCERLRETIGK